MSDFTAKYYCPLPGSGKGNLMWSPEHRMRGGKFPASHPLSANPEPMTIGRPTPTDDPLGKFRALGYWASCFPEGDGLCFDAPEGVSFEQIIEDVRACFPWRIVVMRATPGA